MALRNPIVDANGRLTEMPTGDYVKPSSLGSGSPSSNTILDGTGTWVTVSSLNYWVKSGSNIYYNAGNVMVGHDGTTYTGYTFSVLGNTLFTKETFGSPASEDGYRIKLRDYGGTANDAGMGIHANTEAFWFNNIVGGGFYWNNGSGGEIARLDGSGNFGIGCSPNSKLQVRAASNARFWLDNSSSNTPYAYFEVNTAGVAYLAIQAGDSINYRNVNINPLGGKVLVGTTTETTYKVTIQGGSAAHDGLYVNGHIKATGNIIADGYISGTSSDRRYKSDFETISVIDKIDNIKVSSYQHKLYGKRMIGSIAQEIKRYFPEVVYKDDNGMYRLYDNGYAAIALQLGKEIKSEVDKLKDRVRDLEKQIEFLSR